MNAGGKVTVAGLFSGKGGVGRFYPCSWPFRGALPEGRAGASRRSERLPSLLGLPSRHGRPGAFRPFRSVQGSVAGKGDFPKANARKGFFCAPPEEEGFCTDPEGYWAALEQGAAAVEASFLLLDLPATMTGISAFLLEKTDIPLSVTTGEKAALFGAEAFEAQARAAGKQARLLANRLDMTDLSSYRNGRESVKQSIDRTHTPLVGVVPESYELFRCSEEGRIEEASETALCFLNIASRLKGEEVLPFFRYAGGKREPRRSLLGF